MYPCSVVSVRVEEAAPIKHISTSHPRRPPELARKNASNSSATLLLRRPGPLSWRLTPSPDGSQACLRRCIPVVPPDRAGSAVPEMAASRKTNNSRTVPRSPFYKLCTTRTERGHGHEWPLQMSSHRSAPGHQMQGGRGVGARRYWNKESLTAHYIKEWNYSPNVRKSFSDALIAHFRYRQSRSAPS